MSLSSTVLFRFMKSNLSKNNKPYLNLKAAFDYFLSNPLADVDVKKFNEFCGVGVVVTPEEIKKNVLLSFRIYDIYIDRLKVFII
jgi:hypothetical protein